MGIREYNVKRWAFENDKSSGKYKDIAFTVVVRYQRIKGKADFFETCKIVFSEQFDPDIPISHEALVILPVEFIFNRVKKLDNGFEISNSFKQVINDPILEEQTRMNLNHTNIKLFSKEWESIELENSVTYLEETVKKYKEDDQPFKVLYSRYTFLKNNNQCIDNGVVFFNERYRTTIITHNELFYGRSESDKSLYGDSYKKRTRDKWWWKKYYFITVINTKTKEQKKMSFIEESEFLGDKSKLIKPEVNKE